MTYEQVFYENGTGQILETKKRAGQEFFYTYDELNRLKREIKPSTVVTYKYDLLGRVVTVYDSVLGGGIDNEYDDASRLVSVENHEGKIVSYEYDAAGRREKLIYPDSSFVGYTYDNLGRLSYISQDDLIEEIDCSDLISHWRLDGSATDYIGEHDGATGQGTTPGWEQGVFNKALSLDGDDYIKVPAGDGSDFDFYTKDFAIVAWFKTDSTSDQTIISCDNSPQYYRIDVLADGSVQFEYVSNWTWEVINTTSASGYNDGKWHLVVATRDYSSEAKLGSVNFVL